MKQIRFTEEGFSKIKDEYDKLLKSRPEAVMHLKKAREMGDLSENGYYKASRAKLSSIDYNLVRLKYSIKNAVIVSGQNKAQRNTISIGSKIIITDGIKKYNYIIVGDLEANPSEGKISLMSPLGKALENKKRGDIIEIKSPSGLIKYTINSVS